MNTGCSACVFIRSGGWKRLRPQDVFSWEPQERQAGMCCGAWETWCCRQGPQEPPLAVLVYLIHLTTDEGYRLDAVKNYMVDYLENVCRHK